MIQVPGYRAGNPWVEPPMIPGAGGQWRPNPRAGMLTVVAQAWLAGLVAAVTELQAAVAALEVTPADATQTALADLREALAAVPPSGLPFVV